MKNEIRLILEFFHTNRKKYEIPLSDEETIAFRLYYKVLDIGVSMTPTGFEEVLCEYKDEILNPHDEVGRFLD